MGICKRRCPWFHVPSFPKYLWVNADPTFVGSLGLKSVSTSLQNLDPRVFIEVKSMDLEIKSMDLEICLSSKPSFASP